MSSNNLIIIGNGMAANRLLQEMGTDHPFDQVIILSGEKSAHYNRIMLSPLLAGETTLEAITPHDEDWYQQRRAQVYLNHWVTQIDTDKRQLQCANNRHFDFDALVIATGSTSFIPDISGSDADNVIGFRDLYDVDYMLKNSDKIQHATVIGAGLLGVEAAVGLKAQGIDVTLLHRNPVLMNRQLDSKASDLLEQALSEREIDVQTGTHNICIHTQDNHANRISWQYKEQPLETDIATDLVVFATGIKPTTRVAEMSGLNCDRGVQVDDRMRTSIKGVYALGECCQFENFTYGLVAPIWEQAKVLASQLRGDDEQAHYEENQHLTKLKVSGLDVHSLGIIHAAEQDEEILLNDDEEKIYRKLVLNNNRLIGALCVGDVTDSQWYFDLMRKQTDIQPLRNQLILGNAFCEAQGAAN